MNRISLIIIAFILTASLFCTTIPLNAQQQPSAPAKTAIPQPQETKKEAETIAPPPRPGIAYQYKGAEKRDPFTPLVVKQEAEMKKGMPPLQSFEVPDIKIVAIIWGKKGFLASIVLPDGKSFTVREGMIIGSSGGKITKITKDTLTIRERQKDYRGTIKEHDSVLKLRVEEK
jgi:Tfp pilus assembly protein PilP